MGGVRLLRLGGCSVPCSVAKKAQGNVAESMPARTGARRGIGPGTEATPHRDASNRTDRRRNREGHQRTSSGPVFAPKCGQPGRAARRTPPPAMAALALDAEFDVPAMHCGWSTLGRLNTLARRRSSRSIVFHQRRQRGLHRADRRSPSVSRLRAAGRAARGSGCRAAPRSSAAPSPESPARSAPSPTEKPGILLYGLGMIAAPAGNTPMFRRCTLSGRVGLEGHALLGCLRRACARVISARASGCSASGTPSAAAAHWRVWSSGVAPMPPQQNTTSPLAKASRKAGGDAACGRRRRSAPRPAPGRARRAVR